MKEITTRQTVDEISALQLFTSLRQHEASVSHRLKELGIPRKDIVFSTMIHKGLLASTLSLNEFHFKNNSILIAENIIANQRDATPGYNGDTIRCKVESEIVCRDVRVRASASIEVNLPLEYVGVLVAIGRLRVTNGTVACGF